MKVSLSITTARLLFLILMCLTLRLFAQNRIIYDPIACGYGIKSPGNEWIIKPIYAQITLLEKGYYSCKSGEKWGIIKDNGKILLPAEHDEISITEPSRFMIAKYEITEHSRIRKVGICDTLGHWIIEQKYANIGKMYPPSYLLIKTKDPEGIQKGYESSIADMQGKPEFPFLDGVILNTFYRNKPLIISEEIGTSQIARSKARFINDQGQTLHDSTYDIIMPCAGRYLLIKDRKYGLADENGRLMMAPKYKLMLENQYSAMEIPCIHGDHQFKFEENGALGIIDGEFREIVPPRYSLIQRIGGNLEGFSSLRYTAKDLQTGKMHLLSKDGSIRAIADSFIVRVFPLPKTDYYSATEYKAYCINIHRDSSGEKMGLLGQEGEVLLPALYSHIIFLEAGQSIAMKTPGSDIFTGFSLMDYKDSKNMIEHKLTYIHHVDSIYFYKNENKIYPLLIRKDQNLNISAILRFDLPEAFGYYSLFRYADHHFIIDVRSDRIEKVKYIDIHSGNYPIFSNQRGVNLLHPRKGPLLRQEAESIYQQFLHINRLWVKSKEGSYFIYDSLGNKRSNIAFDEISYETDTFIAKSGGRFGIMNQQLEWIIKAQFREIYRITPNHLLGICSSGNISVMDLRHPSAADTSFTGFRPLYYSKADGLFYYILERGKESFIMNERGENTGLSEQEIHTKYWTRVSSSWFNFMLMGESSHLEKIHFFSDTVYRYLHRFYLQNMMHEKRVVLRGKQGGSPEPAYRMEVKYADWGKVSLSLSQGSLDRLDIGSNGNANHTKFHETRNWLRLSSGIIKPISFEKVFDIKSKSYRKVVLNAIQNRPGLLSQCHSEEELFQGAKSFYFHASGITLEFFAGEHRSFNLELSKEEISEIESAAQLLPYL